MGEPIKRYETDPYDVDTPESPNGWFVFFEDHLAAVARVERERDAALAVVRGFLDIVSESRGVDGWHRNGDVAEWDEFDVLNQAAALKETP